jgi:hypothetical protein
VTYSPTEVSPIVASGPDALIVRATQHLQTAERWQHQQDYDRQAASAATASAYIALAAYLRDAKRR